MDWIHGDGKSEYMFSCQVTLLLYRVGKIEASLRRSVIQILRCHMMCSPKGAGIFVMGVGVVFLFSISSSHGIN